MKGIKINDNIKKMADLLRSGSRMLNLACPVCNNPIFRNKDGNTYCPTCNRKVLIVNDQNHKNNRIESSKTYSNEELHNLNRTEKITWLNPLQNVIIEKIKLLTNKLKDETQLQLIEIYTKILTNCFDILNKIQAERESF